MASSSSSESEEEDDNEVFIVTTWPSLGLTPPPEAPSSPSASVGPSAASASALDVFHASAIQRFGNHYLAAHHQPNVSAATYETGSLLYAALMTSKFPTSLEIGLATGLSAMYMAQAHVDINGGGDDSIRHICIDPTQRLPKDETSTVGLQRGGWDSEGLQHLEQSKLGRVVAMLETESHRALPALHEAGWTFGVVFIDGMHLYDYILLDFFYADLMLPVGGILVLDDAWLPSVQDAAKFILTNRSYELLMLDAERWSEHGKRYFALRKTANDTRMWNEHNRAFAISDGSENNVQ